MATSDTALLKTTFEAVTNTDPDKKHAEFLQWQQEFNRQVQQLKATTPAQRAEIINRMAASKVVYDSSWWESSAMAFRLTGKNIKQLSEELKVSEEYQKIFKQSYSTILSSLSLQKVPVTHDTLRRELAIMGSAAADLSPEGFELFKQEYVNMTEALLRKGAMLSAANYYRLFQNAVTKQR